MSDAGIKPFLQKPGSVELSELYILLPNGKALDLIDVNLPENDILKKFCG